MSILPAGSAAVAVDTFADLKTVLENTGSAYTDITTVYLFADIQIEYAGISISRSRGEITLDGRDPFDITGQMIHSVTDYNSQATGATIGVRSSSTEALSVTFQNIIWTGRNYFGICFVVAAAAYQNVTLSLVNITYTGPQVVYHRSGLVRIIDCSITIAQGYSAAEEVCELNRLELGGVTTITHQESASSSVFSFVSFTGTGTAPYFTVLPVSNVTVTTVRDVIYSDSEYIPITIGENAVLDVTTARGMFRSASMRASSVLVDTDAVFNLRRTTSSPAVSTFYCNGEFIVNSGATVYMEANHASAQPLLHFYSNSAALRLLNPRDFALYSSSGNCFGFNAETDIEFHNQQINYWTSPAAFAIAGTTSDMPPYSWRKTDNVTLVEITASATASSTTVLTHNLSGDELDGQPLSLMQLHNVPVFSAGNLPLSVERITYGLYPVSGTTLPFAYVTVEVTPFSGNTFADENGYFSLNMGEIPVGMVVTGASNIPFLISRFAQESEEPGELRLLDVPAEIRFAFSVVADTPVILYSRQNPDWELTVSDDRNVSQPWYLYASITGPLVSVTNSEHMVPGALVFVDENGEVTELDGNLTLVFTGEGNQGQTLISSVSWEAAKGILLQSVPHPYYNGEEYRAPIVWTLSETEQ